MGWYRIDPETGKPLSGPSSLSQPPDFVLLNAVPGAHDDEVAWYLGDGPWDMGSELVKQLRELLPADRLSPDEARKVILDGKTPRRLSVAGTDLRQAVQA